MTDEQYKLLNDIRRYAHDAWESLPDKYKDYWYDCGLNNFLEKIFELFWAETLWANMSIEEIDDLLQDSLYD